MMRETYRENSFAIKLMSYRLDNGYSQKQMAECVGATQAQICLWENGIHYPSKLRVEKLWKFLNTAV